MLSAAAAGTSSLTHLTIHSGSIAPQPLQYILSIPRALTHFVYQPTLEDIAFDLAPFGVALLPLQHSPTSLELDFRMINPWWLSQLPITTIGSLRDWPALRTVRCTLFLLLGRDSQVLAGVLPAGIRELEILDDVEIPVGAAVKAVVGQLGAMEMVRVYAGRKESKRLRRRLRKACWAVAAAFDDGAISEGSG
ncbi:hypothetical protein Q9L58_008313 [Maublancomyces gigas]|uniref:Uncharacterized protein n=1 Tax=Discina gigas TaxID=1032678 RepID=A0ABR3GA17_9PEZI